MRRAIVGFWALVFAGVLVLLGTTGAVRAEPPNAPPSDSPSPSPTPTDSPGAKEPAIEPDSADFGVVCTGTSSEPATFTITNRDNDVLTITAIAVAEPFVVNGPTSTTLLAGRTTTFTVTYRPDGAGADEATVLVETDHGSVQTLVTGRGLDRQVSVAPSALSFGPQRTKTRSAPRTLTIANTGTEPLAVTVSLGGAGAKDFTLSEGGSFVLEPGAVRRPSLTFLPSSDGPKSATVSVSSNACVDGVRSVSVTGTGARPVIGVRPTKLELTGIVGKEGPAQTVTVTDVGDAPLTVTSVKLGGAGSKEFALSGLPRFPATLPAADSFSFDVRFLPLAVTDPPPTATIEIASNDAKKRLVRIPITVLYESPSPTPSPSVSAPAAPPPPPKDRGPRFDFGSLRGYVSVLVVMLIVGSVFAALMLLRELKRRRVIRRWSNSHAG